MKAAKIRYIITSLLFNLINAIDREKLRKTNDIILPFLHSLNALLLGARRRYVLKVALFTSFFMDNQVYKKKMI